MKKLWTVEITNEIVVLAESQAEATEEAQHALRDCSFDAGYPGLLAREMRYYPDDWEESSIPYGAENDKTIAQYLEEGAAPLLREPRATVLPGEEGNGR